MYLDAHSDIWRDVTARRQAGEDRVMERCHLPRLRQGGCEGAVLALWIDQPRRAAERTEEMMACLREEAAESRAFRIVRTVEEARQARAAGVFYTFLGAEGLAAIGEDVSRIDWYYDYGVRLAMLTWNEVNALAAGAVSGETGGLTDAGRRAVDRIRELGMVMDVSHLNETGFWEVLDRYGGPIVASHSNCRALCDVPRNLTDAQLRAIAASGGVVGVNVYGQFVCPDAERRTAEQLALHAAHMAEVMGVEHVGCGFDFCEFLPGGSTADNLLDMRDSGQAGRFFQCLERLGMSAGEREMIARGNFLGLLERVVG